MAKGFPLFATLTEPALPSTTIVWFDLDALQSGPGKATVPPVRFVQRDPRIGLLYLSEGQFRPRQADRGHGQAGEKLGWRNLLRRNRHGLGNTPLGHTKRLQLLLEAVPGVTRVAALQHGAFVRALPARQRMQHEVEEAARALGIHLQVV